MVSKNITILSLLLPVAVMFGTSLAIFFYNNSSIAMLFLYAGGGLAICIYIIILRSDKRRSVR